jgi:hypothetical protein
VPWGTSALVSKFGYQVCNHEDTMTDQLRQSIVTMEARRLVRASGSRMMIMYIKLQVTIEAHFPTAVNRVMEVPLQLGNEPVTCNLTSNFLGIP